MKFEKINIKMFKNIKYENMEVYAFLKALWNFHIS